MAFHILGSGGAGGGLLYPDSADRPLADDTARDVWANSNKADLIKDTTVVNVGGTQWYLWTGDSNPQTFDNTLWMEAAEIVQGQKGEKGDKGDAGGKLPYVLLSNPQGDLNKSTDGQTYDMINLGVFDGIWSSINPKSDISGGPNPPDGNFDGINELIPVEFVQDVNDAVTPSFAKQWMTTYQDSKKTTYFRAGSNLVGDANDIGSSSWSVVNMIPIAFRDTSSSGASFISSRVLAMGGGLQADFEGDTAILKSLAPYSDIDIKNTSFEIDSLGDGKTLVYQNSTPTDQDSIWLSAEAKDVPVGFSVTIVNNPSSMTSPQILLGPSKNLFIPLIPGSGVVFKKMESGNSYNAFKISGVPFKGISDEYLDLSPEVWKDVAQNTYHTDIGTISNMDPSVNGKQARLIAQVYNTDQGEDQEPVVYHLYTLISEDQGINGLKFSRSGLSRDKFLASPMIKVGSESFEGGFTLNKSAAIGTTDENGVTSDSFGFIGPGNFFVGPINNEHDTTIQGKDAIYANLASGDVKKILLEGDTPSGDGFPDNGIVNNLSTSFDNLAVGKWYVDGWQDSSGLPNDWGTDDRVACLTNFGGYYGKINGSFSLLASHRKGVYAYVFSAGVGVPSWLKLDNEVQSSPTLTIDVAHDWNDSQTITASDIANALGKVQSDDISTHTDNLGAKSLGATTFKVQRPESDGKATSPFAYTFFAFPKDFFTDEDGNLSEPTMVNTGSGNSTDWIISTVNLDGTDYQVMISPSRNSAPLLPSAKLVQPGVLRK